MLVISTPPGFTSKWLAPRLYRFSIAYPEIDVRVSSSINNANFTTDGVDAAIRNLPVDAAHDEALEVEKLIDQSLVPVCSPAFVEKHGPFTSPDMLKGVPLIHDDSLSSRAVMPNWADWFAAAGVRDADVSHGLRFNSADHALDATVEGAGVLLALDALAYDDLRTGRLVMPFDLTLPSGRCYSFVCPKKRREFCERAGLPRVAEGRGDRARLEQVRRRAHPIRAQWDRRDALNCENGEFAAPVSRFNAIVGAPAPVGRVHPIKSLGPTGVLTLLFSASVFDPQMLRNFEPGEGHFMSASIVTAGVPPVVGCGGLAVMLVACACSGLCR